MKVADLQQHIADLTKLLTTAGAKGGAADLAAVRDALEPFRDQSLHSFAEFLQRADATARTGEPRKPTPKSTEPKSRTHSKASPINIQELAQRVGALYDRAADPTVTVEQIEATLAPLRELTLAGLITVADALELKGMKGKTKDAVATAIRRRLLDRKGAAQRVKLIVQPSSPPDPDLSPE